LIVGIVALRFRLDPGEPGNFVVARAEPAPKCRSDAQNGIAPSADTAGAPPFGLAEIAGAKARASHRFN
jgi:hypothetical protein